MGTGFVTVRGNVMGVFMVWGGNLDVTIFPVEDFDISD